LITLTDDHAKYYAHELTKRCSSASARNDLHWPSPSAPDQQARASEYRDHHTLCAKDDPDDYVHGLMSQVM